MTRFLAMLRSLSLAVRQRLVNWLLAGVHIQGALFGQQSITISPAGVGDVVRWSASQAPVAAGDLGMDTATGRPQAYVGGAAVNLAITTDTSGSLAYYGNGSDGAPSALDGTNAAPAWAVKSSNDYTMNRDCACTTLTITSPGRLIPAGFVPSCSVKITGSGTVVWDGNNASGATNGAALTAVGTTGSRGGVGGAGRSTNGNGNNGGGFTTAGVGGSGGVGGTVGGNGGGTQQTSTTTATNGYKDDGLCWILHAMLGLGGLINIDGGAGGNGGASDGGGSSSGGGGGGARCGWIFAKEVDFSGTWSAKGGNGGNATGGNNGGGGGGGGARIYALYNKLTTAPTTTVTGGVKGNGAGTGTNGNDGNAGDYAPLLAA